MANQFEPQRPAPTNSIEVRDMLWFMLGDSLAYRRANDIPLGTRMERMIRLHHRNGSPINPIRHADLNMDSEGKIIVGDHLGLWPDEVHGETTPIHHILLEEVAKLVRLGVIVQYHPTLHFYITTYGTLCLDRDEVGIPITDHRRVERLEKMFAGVPELDIVVRHYAEAVSAYERDLLLSATVMIGCCYECGLVQLAQAVNGYCVRAGTYHDAPDGLQGALRCVCVEDAYVSAAALDSAVSHVLGIIKKKLGRDKGWVQRCLHPHFNFVIDRRNAAGHPTGKEVSRDELMDHLVLFPNFFERVRSVISTLESLP